MQSWGMVMPVVALAPNGFRGNAQMKTVSVRIDDDVKERWEALAEAHGLSSDNMMSQALVEKLEELEEFYVVKERIAKPFTPVSDADVWKRFGLAD